MLIISNRVCVLPPADVENFPVPLNFPFSCSNQRATAVYRLIPPTDILLLLLSDTRCGTGRPAGPNPRSFILLLRCRLLFISLCELRVSSFLLIAPVGLLPLAHTIASNCSGGRRKKKYEAPLALRKRQASIGSQNGVDGDRTPSAQKKMVGGF